jgi:hypothetical protein
MRLPGFRLAALLLAPFAVAACGDNGGSTSTLCESACDAPPAAFCDGETFVAFAPTGDCVDEECRYESVSLECTVGCTPTGCVAEECNGETCDTPPAAACDGNTALNYAPTGTCEDEGCVYAELAVDCTASGQECRDGLCVSVEDLCADVVCDAPPAASCAGDVATTYAEAGTCSEGECTYTPTTTDCALTDDVCLDGACVAAVDPCAEVTCDAPPAPTCDGDVAVIADAVGTCGDGICAYTSTRVDCATEGNVCREGACVVLIDLCADVICDAPPATTCELDTIVAYEAVGTCFDGLCNYDQLRTNCSDLGQICDAGACINPPDLCADVTCDAPPAAFCDGDGNLVTYPAAGTCVAGDGSCDYIADVESCGGDNVCADGACIPVVDPCEGVVCDEAPAASCASDSSITVYAELGVCSGEAGSAICSYVPTTSDCPAATPACDAGVCQPVPEAGDLVITELLYDPDGLDDGKEWIELRNTSDEVLLLRGTGVSWTSGSLLFGATYLNPGAFLVLEASASATPATNVVETDELVLNNTADFVEITRGAVGIDRIEYDETDGYPAAVGRSLALDPSTTANDVAANWCFGVAQYVFDNFSLGSPGVVNPACDFDCFDVECPVPSPTCDGDTRIVYSDVGECIAEDGSCDYSAVEIRTNCADSALVCIDGFCRTPPPSIPAGSLVINEFFTRAAGTGGDDWIEILNATASTIELENLVLSNALGDSYTFGAFALEAGAYLVIGGNPLAVGTRFDLSWDASDYALAPDADSIVLTFGAVTVDRVDFDDEWPRVDSASTAFAGRPIDDNNSAAFWCTSRVAFDEAVFGTPGEENDNCFEEELPPPPDIEFGALVITEIMVDPTGADDDVAEWFEIYNPTIEAIDLRSLEIRSNNAGETFTIGRDGFFVNGRPPLLGSTQRIVIARSFGALGESTEATSRVGYVQTSMMLDNNNDTIAIYTGDTLVDDVNYTDGGGIDFPWPYAPGVSVALSDLSTAADQNDEWFTWCEAPLEAFYATFGGIEQRGTPGVQNGICGF